MVNAAGRRQYKAALKCNVRGQLFEAHGTQEFVESLYARWLARVDPDGPNVPPAEVKEQLGAVNDVEGSR